MHGKPGESRIASGHRWQHSRADIYPAYAPVRATSVGEAEGVGTQCRPTKADVLSSIDDERAKRG